jgi:molybdopterin-guanine dinucleotide biosynthesis protein B
MKTVAVVGHKDAGKTRVVEGLVRYLTGKGFTVGTVKHVHGRVTLEPRATDSARHLRAGAACAVTVSDLMMQASRTSGGEGRKSAQRMLDEALARHLAACDCVIVEGFKGLALPKVVVTSGGGMPPGLTNVVACVYRGAKPKSLPAFRPGEVRKLGEFLLKRGILKPGGAAAHLAVDDKPVPMNEFVARALAGVVEGFVESLRGVKQPAKIQITIKR